MANFPPSTTRRYFLDYTTQNRSHTLMCRTQEGALDDEVVNWYVQVLLAIAPLVTPWSIKGLRRSDHMSNVSYPLAWTGAATYGTENLPSTNQSPKYMSAVGRDIIGSKVRYFFYGTAYQPDANWRMTPNEDGNVNTILAALRSDDAIGVTVSNRTPFLNRYLNIGYNAYWQRQQRV